MGIGGQPGLRIEVMLIVEQNLFLLHVLVDPKGEDMNSRARTAAIEDDSIVIILNSIFGRVEGVQDDACLLVPFAQIRYERPGYGDGTDENEGERKVESLRKCEWTFE